MLALGALIALALTSAGAGRRSLDRMMIPCSSTRVKAVGKFDSATRRSIVAAAATRLPWSAMTAPHVSKRLRRHRRVARCVRDAGVAEIMLEPACIHAAVRQRVAGRVPEHLDVYGERQAS